MSCTLAVLRGASLPHRFANARTAGCTGGGRCGWCRRSEGAPSNGICEAVRDFQREELLSTMRSIVTTELVATHLKKMKEIKSF